jgi:hypothetical protein
MNIRAGSFRLWLLLSVLWVFGTGWLLRDDLLGNCSEPINPHEPNICELAHKFGGPSVLFDERVRVIAIALGPPILTLFLGLSLLWVGRGFLKTLGD